MGTEISAVDTYRSVLQTDYCEYVKYVHQGSWKKTPFHTFLCKYVQNFVERETDKPYEILVISTPPQHGKQIADFEPVLTRSGWKKHGDLIVGDEVVGLDGKWKRVLEVHPKYVQDCLVTFSDGTKIQCHENHEWRVHDRNAHKIRDLETKYIENRVSCGSQEKKRGHRYNFMLPTKKALVGEAKALYVNPYVLGVWLGGGSTYKAQICACDADPITLDECRQSYPEGGKWVHKDTGVTTYSYKGLMSDLREYGLCRKGIEKHIPCDYLTAHIDQRLELLAGLIDTGGYVDQKHRRVVFTTSDERLKDTFCELIATFGWGASVNEYKPFLSSSGTQGKKIYWQIGFNPTMFIPCRIQRKKLYHFSKQRRISICKVERVEQTIGNCITVEGGIYLVGKSMIPTHNSQSVTETLPSWYLGRHPDNRVIEISYNEDFAIKFGRRNRKKIEEFGGSIFGIKLAKDNNRAVEFELQDHLGGMLSRGVGTGVTGQPANLMIIDDPIKNRKEAYSKSRRDLIYEEWLMSFKTRLAPHSKVILIMTRWHEDDLAGRLLAEENNIKLLSFPCECESKNDLLRREIGDALCPEIGKGKDWLEEFKASFITREGSMTWNALFQGRPTAMEGNVIEREWWEYYGTGCKLPELPQIHTWIMSVDATFKDEAQSDFVAIQVWGKTGANCYLIDAVKKHLNFPDTIMEIRRLRGMYPECKTTLIEDRANGSAIITMLRREMTGIIAVQPIGSKMARVQAILGSIESGNIYLPKDKRFTGDFVEECSSFPNAAHDDQVDCMSQALNRLIYQRATSPVAEKLSDFDRMFPLWRKQKGKGHGKVQVI